MARAIRQRLELLGLGQASALGCVCTVLACNPGGLIVRPPAAGGAGGGRTTVAATGGGGGGGSAGRAPGAFYPTGSMTAQRSGHTATLLANGTVLIAGGWRWNRDNLYSSFAESLASAEVYDPQTGTFAATGTMSQGRNEHAAALLPNGKVLIAGGWGTGCFDYGCVLTSAELYDPETGTFTATDAMKIQATWGTATSLPSGEVLFAGGAGATATLQGAQLYDPTSGTFVLAASMREPRQEHAAVALGNGNVLVTGGSPESSCSAAWAGAEVFDPSPRAFASTGTMRFARMDHIMTLLRTGKVLIAGGYGGARCDLVRVAELYDLVTGSFSATGGVVTLRSNGTSTLLSSGKVLLAGGMSWDSQALERAEVYDPESGSFTRTADMGDARVHHTATLLPDGDVLIVGGDDRDQSMASAELYRPF